MINLFALDNKLISITNLVIYIYIFYGFPRLNWVVFKKSLNSLMESSQAG
jgi:hypothetical protein